MYKNFRIFQMALRISILLLFLLGSFALPSQAHAANITVNTNADSTNVNGLCSLREAIDNANNDALTHADCVMGSGNDTIQFANSLGTSIITLVSTLPTISDADGLTINGGGDITIHGNNLFRILLVGSSVLTLDSIILTNGKCISCNGSAIYVSGGTLTVMNSTLSNNSVGSALYSYNGVLTITNSNFSNNNATYGAAIQVASATGTEGIASITNSTFSNNSAPSGGGGSSIYNSGDTTITGSTFANDTSGAGSIYNNAILSITGSTFSGNTATDLGGGAIYNNNPGFLLTINDSTFAANDAPSAAGGAILHGGGSITITNSTFSDNLATAGTGGGIYTYNNAALVVTNSTFSANSAGTGGGIFSLNSSVFTVRNSTFSGNGAVTGGAIYNQDTASFILQNTILANSTSGSDCYNVNGDTINTNTNNLIETNGPSGNMCGTPQFTGDPILGALAINGGTTETFALLNGSPAIDNGNDAVCAAAPVSNTSQNGAIRLQGAHCDIGSFEKPMLTLIVKSLNTSDGWILESKETSGKGGTLNSTDTTFLLGDDLADRQYRAILHFDTSSLPDNAIITSVILKIKKQGMSGTNPFSILGGLQVDIRKPAFGGAALALTDFKSAAGANNVGTFGLPPIANWYSATLNPTGQMNINLSGTTQFRLRFAIDDNNDNGNDFMKFQSGNAGVAQRPQLIVNYVIP